MTNPSPGLMPRVPQLLMLVSATHSSEFWTANWRDGLLSLGSGPHRGRCETEVPGAWDGACVPDDDAECLPCDVNCRH